MFAKIRISIFTKIFLISFISSLITLIFIAILIYWIFSEARNYSFFSFFFAQEHIFDNDGNIFLIVFFVGLLLSCCYLTIRQILKPLDSIQLGVMELSKGNLDFRLKKKHNDELGDIKPLIHNHSTQSFNQMSEKLSQLIDSKKQLLLNLSHEIKTPITRTKLSLELLDKNKHTLSIQEDIKDIELIIDSILGAERIASQNHSAKTESIYLEPVIQKIVHSHSVANIIIKYLIILIAVLKIL